MSDNVSIEDVKNYWKDKNIPQQWYSNKDKLSIQFFNELSYQRFEVYYPYLKDFAEFKYHRGEKVLEIGCGAGTDAIEYALNNSKVSCIDLGEDQVELTRINFKARNLDYDEIKIGNAENLQFEDANFDLVYSFGVLHHTPNIQKTADEIHRVLKDDGVALIMLYSRGWKHYVKRCFVHGILKGKIFKHNFNWQKIYNEVSEVNGSSPLTKVYTKKEIKNIFSKFDSIEISRDRMGEFFEYRPYNTVKFPDFITKLLNLFSIYKIFGENWKIKLKKRVSTNKKTKLRDVFFKHY